MGSESQTPRNGGGHRVGMQPLPRQNSIYSLTLEQFQSTMVEPGKSFGSMNMDDFLKNIWTVEENQAMAAALGGMNDAAPGGLAREQSLQLQGLLTLPRTLSKKTVDEVWKDIHKEPVGTLKEGGKSEPDRQPRQLTFGEMTLEDFLLKAGVVKEDLDLPSQSFTPYMGGIGTQSNLAGGVGSPFGKKENGMVAGSEASSGIVTNVPLHVNVLTSENVVDSIQLDSYKNVVPTPRDWLSHPYQRPTVASMAKGQQHQLQEAEVSSYLNTTKRIENGTISAAGIGGMNAASGFAPLGGIGLVGGVSKGGGGIGLTSGLAEGLGPGGLGMGTCSSASDEIDPSYCNEYGFSPVGSYGIDGGLTGRKRGALGLVEKVADRRQRRMIKNRESAARSRARKQAYTMELEAEVSQLKEENFRLRIQQEEDVERRKQQMHDIMASLAQEMRSKTKVLRRTQTGPW